MQTTLYVRAAKTEDGELIVKASPNVNYASLEKRQGRTSYVLPTVSFAIQVNLDDEMFEEAERVIANINVQSEEVENCDVIRVLNP